MIYVGVVARLLSLDMQEVERAIRRHFGSKPKAAELNWNAARAGYDYAAASLTKADPFVVERMQETAGKIIIDGNAAAALGAMFGGRHGRHLVSDHAFVVADRKFDRIHEAIPR